MTDRFTSKIPRGVCFIIFLLSVETSFLSNPHAVGLFGEFSSMLRISEKSFFDYELINHLKSNFK